MHFWQKWFKWLSIRKDEAKYYHHHVTSRILLLTPIVMQNRLAQSLQKKKSVIKSPKAKPKWTYLSLPLRIISQPRCARSNACPNDSLEKSQVSKISKTPITFIKPWFLYKFSMHWNENSRLKMKEKIIIFEHLKCKAIKLCILLIIFL